MKKMLRVFAVLMCLLMAVPAFAEPVKTQSGLVDADWINDTNFLSMPGNPAYYFTSLDGSVKTMANLSGMTYDSGYIVVTDATVGGLNCTGLMSTTGEIIIVPLFGIVDVLSDEWAIAIKLVEATADLYDYSSYSGDVFYKIEEVEVYSLASDAYPHVFSREQYYDSYVVNHCINIQKRSDNSVTTYDQDFNVLGNPSNIGSSEFAPADYVTFRDNGQYGIQDAAGNVVMPASFQTVYLPAYGDYGTVNDGSGEGLVRIATGEVVVPADFDSIKRVSNLPQTPDGNMGYEVMGYFCVVKDGKVGYVREGGEFTCQPTYSKDVVEINGASFILTDLEGNKRLISADGVETVLSGYDRVYAFYHGSGVYYKVTNADGKYGVIDWHGEVVMPCEYVTIDMSGDGQYLLVSTDYTNHDIYQLTYPTAGAQAPAVDMSAAEAPVEASGEASETSGTVSSLGSLIGGAIGGNVGGSSDEEATEEAPVETPAETPEEAPVEAPSSDYSAVTGLLTSAVTLLENDSEANGTAAVSLINNAVSMLGDKADVVGLLTSAVTLLNTDAAANGSAAVALINSAIGMLK